jgi:PEP-CTERM motif
MNKTIFALAAFCSLTSATHAEFILTFTQVGNNVVATGSGSLNIFNMSLTTTGSLGAEVYGSFGTVIAGPQTATPEYAYRTTTGPTNFGPGSSYIAATSGSGDIVGVAATAQEIIVPAGYISGHALSNTSTWNNTTIAGLGLTPGTYTSTWATDSFEVAIVPEPSSLILLALTFAAVGLLAWTRRRRGSAETAV